MSIANSSVTAMTRQFWHRIQRARFALAMRPTASAPAIAADITKLSIQSPSSQLLLTGLVNAAMSFDHTLPQRIDSVDFAHEELHPE